MAAMLNSGVTDFWMRSVKLGVVKDLAQSLEPAVAVRPEAMSSSSLGTVVICIFFNCNILPKMISCICSQLHWTFHSLRKGQRQKWSHGLNPTRF